MRLLRESELLIRDARHRKSRGLVEKFLLEIFAHCVEKIFSPPVVVHHWELRKASKLIGEPPSFGRGDDGSHF